MYESDGKDRVVELPEVPTGAVGGSSPRIVASDEAVVLSYLADEPEGRVTVTFERCLAHYLGPPHDEVLDGHPLWEKGLFIYGVYRVDRSSWIRRLESLHAIHADHAGLKHFIWTFAESTFEVLAEGFAVSDVAEPPEAADSAEEEEDSDGGSA